MSYFSINRVVLVGRLTRDPELRALPSGVSVCGLRVACSSSRKDSDGDYHERPNFFDVSVYGGSAESVSRYMRKGGRVAIDGRLEWREWETPDQQRRQAVSIVADTVQFLDSPGGRSEIGQRREPEPGDELDEGAGDAIDRRSAGELVGVGAGAEEADLVF
ncbi:MAG TPA: single-stranded DNA-binding protein [Solirubrobacteraceae bacterium]|nr:single-stranded DNA-binding protein [Solirubrobacteraceae bacterium]